MTFCLWRCFIWFSCVQLHSGSVTNEMLVASDNTRKKGRSEQMCRCCLYILPLPPQSSTCFDEAERAGWRKAEQSWHRLRWVAPRGGSTSPPSQLQMLTNIITAHSHCHVPHGDDSEQIQIQCLRLICELSASGIPEDNDPCLGICLFYTAAGLTIEMLANSYHWQFDS